MACQRCLLRCLFRQNAEWRFLPDRKGDGAPVSMWWRRGKVLLMVLGFTGVWSPPAMKELPQGFSDHGERPQTAVNPDQTVMNINNLTTWVRSDGYHYPVVDGSWNGTFPKGKAGVVFSEGILWGGIVNDGVSPFLRVGGSTHSVGNTAGAILTDESGNVLGVEDPDDPSVRPYRVRFDWVTDNLRDDAANFFLIPEDEVTETQIEEIRTQYELDWNKWPGEKGAPYEEINGVYGYQPATWNESEGNWNDDGDIPGISGADQTLWIVYNDLDSVKTQSNYGCPPIGLEVQETYWAYSKYFSLKNVVFKRVRMIYTGTTETPSSATIDSMYIVQWSDPDLGTYHNDFVGCDTSLDLGYVYNGHDFDIRYLMEGFSIPPAGGYALLQGPIEYTGDPLDSAFFNFEWRYGYRNLSMSAFTFFGAGTPWGDPYYYLRWYNVMRGCRGVPEFPACDPFLDENGNPTHFELAGDPVTGTGDLDGHPTDANPMRFPPGDRRLVMVTGPFEMARGDTQEVVIVLSGAFGIDYLHSVGALRGTVEQAQLSWESGLTDFGPNAELVELSIPHNTEETGPFEMVFQIEDDPSWEPDIITTKLHYTVGEVQDSVSLEESILDDTTTYSGVIPAFPEVTGTTELHYYVSVDYDDGTRLLLPYGAPGNFQLMLFAPDTSAPLVTEPDSLFDVFYLFDDSAEVNVSAEDDRFPLAVKAKWKVNASGDIHESLMEFVWWNYGTHPNLRWKSQIHWENLSFGDTVYFWVEATDSSMNQNVGMSETKWLLAREYGKIGNWDDELVEDWHLGSSWHLSLQSGFGKVMHIKLGYPDPPDTLQLIRPLIMTGEFPEAFLAYSHKYLFVNPSVGTLEIRVEDGDWEQLKVFTGQETDFYPDIISLNQYMGTDSLFLRFRVEKNESEGTASWWLDDIYLTIDSTILAVEDPIGTFPTEYKLYQNYPNPFNPITAIEFSIPQSGHVTLTVYDLLGREVETILRQEIGAGHHKVQWSANNVPSGIYFVRMLAPAFSQVRKLTVLK